MRIVRHGLRESLEEFAARIGSTPERARSCWRLQGLRFLRAFVPAPDAPAGCVRADALPWEALLAHVGPDTSVRVAPGVEIPTNDPVWP